MSPAHLSKEQVQEIGALLKSSRERQNENLAEVAFRIALSPSQLRAIEAGDLRPFYSAGYFLQAAERYANFLNVKLPKPEPRELARGFVAETDTAQVPAENPATQNATQPQESIRAPTSLMASKQGKENLQTTSSGPRSQPWGWLAFGAAVLITLGILKISLDKPAEEGATVIATATAETPSNTQNDTSTAISPAPAMPAPPAAKPTAPPPAIAPAAPAAAATTSQDRLANPSSKPVNTLALGSNDSQLESQTSTWVQLVRTNGEKTNLKIEPGQKIEFAANATAAVVFGQPEKAVLKIKDKAVNLKPFITADNPSRALVILNQIRD